MGNDCGKTNENIYFKCRKEAALYDKRLFSRESAADLLGMSVSSLSDYELGITKVVPDNVLQARLSHRRVLDGGNRNQKHRVHCA